MGRLRNSALNYTSSGMVGDSLGPLIPTSVSGKYKREVKKKNDGLSF
jgi:hypothetical protein